MLGLSVSPNLGMSTSHCEQRQRNHADELGVEREDLHGVGRILTDLLRHLDTIDLEIHVLGDFDRSRHSAIDRLRQVLGLSVVELLLDTLQETVVVSGPVELLDRAFLELVLILDENNGKELCGFDLKYEKETGLIYTKKE